MAHGIFLKKIKESNSEKYYEVFHALPSNQNPIYIKVNEQNNTLIFSANKEFSKPSQLISLTENSILPKIPNLDKRISNKIIFLIYKALQNKDLPEIIEYAS